MEINVRGLTVKTDEGYTGTLSTFDSDGNMIYFNSGHGIELWQVFDSYGYKAHYKSITGFEAWYDSDGESITKDEYDMLED